MQKKQMPLRGIDVECAVRTAFYSCLHPDTLQDIITAKNPLDLCDDLTAIAASSLPSPHQPTRRAIEQLGSLCIDLPKLMTDEPENDGTLRTPFSMLYENALTQAIHYGQKEQERLKKIGRVLSMQGLILYGEMRRHYVLQEQEGVWLELALHWLGLEQTWDWTKRVRAVLQELIDVDLVERATCDDEQYILSLQEQDELKNLFPTD